MKAKKNKHHFMQNKILGLTFLFLMFFCFFKVYVRIQSTLIGYKLGQLKSSEADLMEERSSLQMELSKLTSKQHLSEITR
jgi:hypothetical protein